jgi:tRNA(Ile)-lysidine synthase
VRILAFAWRLWSGESVNPAHSRTKLSDFDFKILCLLEPLRLSGKRVLIACSGGKDSVALVHCLVTLQARLGLEIAVAHVHHGSSSDVKQNAARDEAKNLVETLARDKGIGFFSETADGSLELTSEEELREFRLVQLSKLLTTNGFDLVALGHHDDDLLETRLFRLIRGTGSQGLAAMELFDEAGKKIRPFLREAASAVSAYAEQNGLRWIEDPSNAETKYFRNWLRKEWLPQLETKRPGSVRSLSRSLKTLNEEFLSRETSAGALSYSEEKLDRKAFSLLETVEKGSVLANYVRTRGARNFSRGCVEEVIKRMHHLESTGQKREQFFVGGLNWSVEADSIRAELPQLEEP